MTPSRKLHELGQSLWLDNIARELLTHGVLKRYIDDLSMTGMTSNPTIFDNAIKNSAMYDLDISPSAPSAGSGEDVLFSLALADLTRAAELFQPVFARTDGLDGCVPLEVSPLLTHDAKSTLAAALDLHRRAAKPNLLIKIAGTVEGPLAIEEAIVAGVPVNVTLLFSCEQYVAAAEAYLRGDERRIAVGKNSAVASVASLFVAQRTYKAYRELRVSPLLQRAANNGARRRRTASWWRSTSTASSPRASGRSIPSINGAWTWARRWPRRSFRSWRAKQPRSLHITARPTR